MFAPITPPTRIQDSLRNQAITRFDWSTSAIAMFRWLRFGIPANSINTSRSARPSVRFFFSQRTQDSKQSGSE